MPWEDLRDRAEKESQDQWWSRRNSAYVGTSRVSMQQLWLRDSSDGWMPWTESRAVSRRGPGMDSRTLDRRPDCTSLPHSQSGDLVSAGLSHPFREGVLARAAAEDWEPSLMETLP